MTLSLVTVATQLRSVVSGDDARRVKYAGVCPKDDNTVDNSA
jgi:hypothetical protein